MAITSLHRYATEAAASLPSTVIRRLLVDIRCLPGGEEPAWKHRREGGAEKRHPEGCRAGPPLGVEGVGKAEDLSPRWLFLHFDRLGLGPTLERRLRSLLEQLHGGRVGVRLEIGVRVLHDLLGLAELVIGERQVGVDRGGRLVAAEGQGALERRYGVRGMAGAGVVGTEHR